jgi:hypothetical protein
LLRSRSDRRVFDQEYLRFFSHAGKGKAGRGSLAARTKK